MKKNSCVLFVSDSQVLQQLDCVYCDIWIPSPIVSNQGFKYFCSFYMITLDIRGSIFSNSSQISILSSLHFKKLENELNIKIQVFKGDGGREFVNNQISLTWPVMGSSI